MPRFHPASELPFSRVQSDSIAARISMFFVHLETVLVVVWSILTFAATSVQTMEQ